jgi:hypothetical protein
MASFSPSVASTGCPRVVAQQQAVGADLLAALPRAPVGLVVEVDGVLGMGDLLGVGLQAVGDVGEAEQRAVPQSVQQPGLMGFGGLQQLEQVDDLVVAPIADMAPGIVLVDHLPVDAVATDAVGVVAVDRHGAEEGRDHRANVGRLAGHQRLPVLEDVAPVALVVDDAPALGVAHPDGEAVPRAARVAVAAAEGQRQVLEQQALGLRLPAARTAARACWRSSGCGRPDSSLGQLGAEAMVALPGEGQQIVTVELGAVDEHAAAHDVEEHVGAVVRGGHRIAGVLEAVGPGQQLVDAGRVVGARAGDLQRAARTGLEAPCQLEGLHLRIGRVDDQMPFPSGLVQFGVELNQEGAAAAAREPLGVQRLAAAEALDLMRRQQGARALGQAAVPGHQGVERFLGFGAIPDLRVQREEAESSAAAASFHL